MDTTYIINAFISLFVIIDPIAVLPTFLLLTKNDKPAAKRRIAIKATVTATIILLAFAMIGHWALRVMGISFPAFQIAGGILLLLAAIDMVVVQHSGIRSTTHDEQEEAAERTDISIFPLAIPLISGPGALTTLTMLLQGVRGDIAMQGAVIGVLFLILWINYICLLKAEWVVRLLGVTGTNAVGRVFGIILAAMAIQFMITGIKNSFYPL